MKRIRRTGGRVVEGTGLENRHTALSYRGFESLPVRHLGWILQIFLSIFLNINCAEFEYSHSI